MSAPDTAPNCSQNPLAQGAVIHVAQITVGSDGPLSRCLSGDSLGLGPAEGPEAVHDGDAGLDFGVLAIRVSGHDPLTEELQAVHLGLDPTSDMVAGPLFPECPAEVLSCAQDLVSRQCCGAVFFPGAAVPADRYDGIGAVLNDGGVASACVVCAIRSDSGDLFALRNLRQQVWQQGLSPWRLEVNATARMSPVSVSMAM